VKNERRREFTAAPFFMKPSLVDLA